MSAKISIITATYNSVRNIESVLDSVGSQDYPLIEHVVIDGASTDGTLEYLKAYRGHPIRLVSEPDRGLYDALNKGIAQSTGDVIGFLHSDDLFSSRSTVSRIASIFEDPGVDGCYGDCEIVSSNNIDRVIRRWTSGEISDNSLSRGWMPPHPTLFLRNAVYRSVGGFDIAFSISADYDFILRLFSARRRIAYIPDTLITMRAGGTSQSIKNTVRKWQEDLHAIRRNRVGGLFTLALKNLRKLHQFL